eukprot:TRINITY_DN12265_c0_g1_i1.p1 TRINITY_DN12265_c0_g1~~TRINITY_DN12265_c0_g1_i1.p1  ORF type:complete len:315 (-),score=74.43 TRINITY_DN12265_c0_g1_i1:210-1133(-)
MSNKAPEFENFTACRKCLAAFTFTTRRHHCRNCGRSFCSNCSKKEIKLPHFGLDKSRVCDACYEKISQTPSKPAIKEERKPTSTPSAKSNEDDFLDQDDMKSKFAQKRSPVLSPPTPAKQEEKQEKPSAKKRVKECKCGLPLCVCPDDEPASPSSTSSSTSTSPSSSSSTTSNTSTTKVMASNKSSSTSTSLSTPSTFVGFSTQSALKYDIKGDLNEQCRAAVKNNDVVGVIALLKAGANPCYQDHAGNTLLHLASMFNFEKIVGLLISAGADMSVKNGATPGETPVDLAQPALAKKMRDGFFKKSS